MRSTQHIWLFLNKITYWADNSQCSQNIVFLLHPTQITIFWVRLMPGFWEWGNKDFVVTHFAQTGCFQSSGFYHGVKWKQLPSAIWFKKAAVTGHSPDTSVALRSPDLCCAAAPQHIRVTEHLTLNRHLHKHHCVGSEWQRAAQPSRLLTLSTHC